MDTFEKTLKRLSQLGYLADNRAFSEQIRAMRAVSDMRDILTPASLNLAEQYRDQTNKLAVGYGLSNVAQDLLARDEAVRVALSNSYRNLTGIDALAKEQLSSIKTLQRQIEEIVSPVARLQSMVTHVQAPESILQSVQRLNVNDGLIGEFAFLDKQDKFPEADEEDSEERQEVTSRIIQVEYIPQRLFEAIHNEPELMRGLSPRKFEEFTAELLSRIGFEQIQITPRSGDGGRDVIATRVINDIPVLMAFECKKYEQNKIGPDFLRALLGTVTHGPTRAAMGVLVTTSSFTAGARSFIASETLIDGRDFDALVNWLLRAKVQTSIS